MKIEILEILPPTLSDKERDKLCDIIDYYIQKNQMAIDMLPEGKLKKELHQNILGVLVLKDIITNKGR